MEAVSLSKCSLLFIVYITFQLGIFKKLKFYKEIMNFLKKKCSFEAQWHIYQYHGGSMGKIRLTLNAEIIHSAIKVWLKVHSSSPSQLTAVSLCLFQPELWVTQT